MKIFKFVFQMNIFKIRRQIFERKLVTTFNLWLDIFNVVWLDVTIVVKNLYKYMHPYVFHYVRLNLY